MRRLLGTVVLVVGIAGCASVKTLEATGGSRSDGTVELSYEYGSLEAPQVQYEQGLLTARERCAAWGYSDAEAFGGQKETCQIPGTYRCLRFFVTVTYQCIASADFIPLSGPLGRPSSGPGPLRSRGSAGR
jgi:YecR-like lipoprotein